MPIGAGAGALHTGGVKIVATIGGVIDVRFGCSPGTVAGPDPGVVTLDDPAASFATTQVAAAGGLSLGKVKLNKKKGTATLSPSTCFGRRQGGAEADQHSDGRDEDRQRCGHGEADREVPREGEEDAQQEGQGQGQGLGTFSRPRASRRPSEEAEAG